MRRIKCQEYGYVPEGSIGAPSGGVDTGPARSAQFEHVAVSD